MEARANSSNNNINETVKQLINVIGQYIATEILTRSIPMPIYLPLQTIFYPSEGPIMDFPLQLKEPSKKKNNPSSSAAIIKVLEPFPSCAHSTFTNMGPANDSAIEEARAQQSKEQDALEDIEREADKRFKL
jgi:hypothetical protein